MSHQYVLIALLVGVCFAALLVGEWNKRRVALALMGNWSACTAFIILSGIADAWHWFLAVDFVTALVVLWPSAGRWQALIGITYLAQIGAHGIYGMTILPMEMGVYLRWLDLFFIAQLALLGSWAGGDLVKAAHRWTDARRDTRAAAAHRKGVGGEGK
ncbi:MAG TPA: hypothetical protein VF389_11665 [Woeseiaceae bacterium]